MHNAQKTSRRGTLHKEMQQALVETAIRYRDAVRRFQDYRRHRGFDRTCSLLIDDVQLSRSLLLVLADEMRRDDRRAAARA
jgi:hypothetical protein